MRHRDRSPFSGTSDRSPFSGTPNRSPFSGTPDKVCFLGQSGKSGMVGKSEPWHLASSVTSSFATAKDLILQYQLSLSFVKKLRYGSILIRLI